MALPVQISYELPQGDVVPTSKPAWMLDPSRAALLIHDMQNYFVKSFAPGMSPIAPVLENITAIRDHCDALGIPVFYSAQPGDQDPRDRGLQRDFWGPGMASAPEHQAIVDALEPKPQHIVLTKWRYSAFQRTNLEPMLHVRGRDQLIVTGIYAHIGCLLTAADAFMRDIEPFFVVDAVADFSREKHETAIRYVAGHCSAPITTAQFLEVL